MAKQLTDLPLQAALDDNDDLMLVRDATAAVDKRVKISTIKTLVQDLIDAAIPSLPVGTMMPYGGTSAPTGFMLCDGSAISRATYSDLYTAIGDAFGEGDGSTTFNLPDMRGRFVRGVDNGQGVDPDAATRTAMATGGNTGDNVGSVQPDAMQGHWHRLQGRQNDEAAGAGNMSTGTAATQISLDDRVRVAISDGVNGTPRTTSESRPKNVNVEWIIKVE